MIILPWFLAEQSLAKGDLVIVMPGYAHESGSLHILMPPARAGVARVRALVAFLADKYGPVV